MTLNFRYFMFRIEPVCFLRHSLATNTTLFYVLFHHNAKPFQNGQLHFQTFQFSYLYIDLHKPLFKSIHQCLKIHFVTSQGQIHYNIITLGLRYKWKKTVYDYVWYIWMIESIYDEHNIETRRKGILKSKSKVNINEHFSIAFHPWRIILQIFQR